MNHRSVRRHPSPGGAMDFSLTPDQETFRQTLRAWLKGNIPREWKHVGSSEIPRVEAYDLLKRWQNSLFDAGFIGLTWPKEYGGRGLTFMEELILQEEMALAKAPPIPKCLGGRKARPGVTVKPLRQITGEAEFNEVFFDNVRVHESQVLGDVNAGWQVGITTLMYERLTLGFALQTRLRIALESLIDLGRRMEKHGRAATKEPVLRQKRSEERRVGKEAR